MTLLIKSRNLDFFLEKSYNVLLYYFLLINKKQIVIKDLQKCIKLLFQRSRNADLLFFRERARVGEKERSVKEARSYNWLINTWQSADARRTAGSKLAAFSLNSQRAAIEFLLYFSAFSSSIDYSLVSSALPVQC